MIRVLFACVHNAGRSQMAAAFFNRMADPALAQAVSAGTEPAAALHPEVLEVMGEAGVELGHLRPQRLDEELIRGIDWLITMGCGESCPVVPGAKREDWNLPDPHRQPLARVRQIRDEILDRVRKMVSANGWRREGKLSQLQFPPQDQPLDSRTE
jgi:arsenate reductase